MAYRGRMPTNEKFHIDPSAFVKFFVYLVDVTTRNGAFIYDLGSHREGYFRMMAYAYKDNPGPYVIRLKPGQAENVDSLSYGF
jgi:hypothetical protein